MDLNPSHEISHISVLQLIIILYDVDHYTVSYAFFSSKTTGVPDDARLH